MADTGFTRPTMAELINRISNDVNARLTGEDSRVRRSLLWVLVRVLAGVAYLLYGYLAWIARQAFVTTADEAGLSVHAGIWNRPRLPGTAAQVEVDFPGAPDGTLIPAGTLMTRADGAEFTVNANTVVAGGTAQPVCTAVLVGEAGNCDLATALTLSSPIAGISSEGLVFGTTELGADEESVERWRSRIIDRIQNTPHAGALADWETWTLEVQTDDVIDRVWVAPLELGDGTVVVRFSRVGTGIDVIPTVPEVAEVQAYLEDPIRRPVTMAVTALAPIALAVDLTIQLNITGGSVLATVKQNVIDQLEALFVREAGPDTTLRNSDLRAAISAAVGQDWHTLDDVNGDGTGLSDVVATFEELQHLGAITWV